MSKYFSIFKMGLKQEKQTIGNTLLAIFSFFVIVIIFKQLWTFIYTEGGGTIINGYTVNMMMWYLIMAESITFILSTNTVTAASTRAMATYPTFFQKTLALLFPSFDSFLPLKFLFSIFRSPYLRALSSSCQ